MIDNGNSISVTLKIAPNKSPDTVVVSNLANILYRDL